MIGECDMVLVCVGGFGIEEEVVEIEGLLEEKSWIGSVVSCRGFLFRGYRILGKRG